MRKQLIVLLALFTVLSSGLKVGYRVRADLEFPEKVTLQGPNGLYLARCHDCPPGLQNLVVADETNPNSPQAVWTLVQNGAFVLLKADNGKFLAPCDDCLKGRTMKQEDIRGLFAISDNIHDYYAIWNLGYSEVRYDVAENQFKFIYYSGNGWLQQCHNCIDIPGHTDMAVISHIGNDLIKDPNSLWNYKAVTDAPVVPEEKFPTGRVTLKSDINTFLSRCRHCGPSNYQDSASLHETNPAYEYAIWTVESVGNKVTFKGDNGNYLARCSKCWNESIYPEAALFIQAASSQDPLAQWTPESLGNGKWALKADNGKYLARCHNCVTGGTYPDFPFVHIDEAKDKPYAQWTVTKA